MLNYTENNGKVVTVTLLRPRAGRTTIECTMHEWYKNGIVTGYFQPVDNSHAGASITRNEIASFVVNEGATD